MILLNLNWFQNLNSKYIAKTSRNIIIKNEEKHIRVNVSVNEVTNYRKMKLKTEIVLIVYADPSNKFHWNAMERLHPME